MLDDTIMRLSSDLHMSAELAKDMLMLAGGKEDIVRQASAESNRLESMKCNIINRRISQIERNANHD